jgi:glycerol-3-phosphate dehydrogenase
MPPHALQRMAGAYGTRVHAVLGPARRLADLGEAVAEGLYEAELDYLVAREWATCAEDVLWRRSKLGLHLSSAQRQRVADWFGRRLQRV